MSFPALLALALSAASPAPAPATGAAAPRIPEPQTSLFQGMGRTKVEQAQLDELSRAVELYENETKEYRKDAQLLIERKYEEKRATLANSYEKAISDLEVVERKERLDAIAQFEEFLKRYPNDPKYTPDVMFRLAELYYERSADDQAVAMRAYEEKLKKQDPSKPVDAVEPQVSFDKSIAIYRTLLERFPNYRLNDGAMYLLGYCLEKQNDFDKGREAYETLIARYPTSRFTTEAWVRLGEYYFDAFNDAASLAKAADAYEHAIQDKTHPLYDKALYKLGWTYYRMDKFDDAVHRFIALVDFYEAQKAASGDDEAGGGDLRNEALQYTAISFSDEKWGSIAKAQETFAKLGGRPYEAEIYRRMGQVYFDQTRHADAVTAFQLVLQKDPLAEDAPQVQEKIIEALQRDRKLDPAFQESAKLADAYGPGTPWYEKHKHDQDTLSSAQALIERSLYSGAIYHHQQALAFKQAGKFAEAKDAFDVAARAYAKYLSRFPHSKNLYEMTFYEAECLYNSLHFADAARTYEAVRDATGEHKYFKEAAFSALLAWQKQLEDDQRTGKAATYKVLKSTERPEGEKPKVVAMVDVEKRIVADSDVYVARLPKEDRAAGIAYKAAELFYVHNDFPEARRRFEIVIKTYPQAEVAKFSTNLIVESFLIDKDWKSVEDTAARLAANKDVIDPKSDLYKDLVKFKLAGRFKLADELMSKGQYDAAAAKYIQLVDEEPHHEFADKALNNAAVAYENTRRFDSALKLYERVFNEYPSSKLADSALFRVAVNAENSYDFTKAVSSYQRLVRDYPASKDREAALFNAARLLEGQQRYREAAQAFTKYAELFPKAEDAPKNIYRAALIYEKEGDYRGEVKALQEFVRKFGASSAQLDLVVDGKKRIGDAQQKLGDDKEAKKAYADAAKEFDRRGAKPDQYAIAADAAAQAHFQLAEYEFQDFDRLKIGGRGKALEKSFKDKRAAVRKVNDAYAEVFKYKRLEWTLAALYRRGYALERFGATIIETPVPPDVKRLGDEAVAAYQDLLAQQTAALEDKAVESYVATLAEARKNHISNVWTKRTLESLNRYRPKEYPVLKEPKFVISADASYPEGLVHEVDGPPKPPPPAPVPTGAAR